MLGRAPFQPSQNEDDWLGHGVYFWEYAPQQAWEWARARMKKRGESEEPAVLGSMIRLGNCLALLDPLNVEHVIERHEALQADYRTVGERLPKNAIARKYLDCLVFQATYLALEEKGSPVDTARAVYVPTGKERSIWKRSWITYSAHTQLCVRNQSCILGTWLVQPK